MINRTLNNNICSFLCSWVLSCQTGPYCNQACHKHNCISQLYITLVIAQPITFFTLSPPLIPLQSVWRRVSTWNVIYLCPRAHFAPFWMSNMPPLHLTIREYKPPLSSVQCQEVFQLWRTLPPSSLCLQPAPTHSRRNHGSAFRSMNLGCLLRES